MCHLAPFSLALSATYLRVDRGHVLLNAFIWENNSNQTNSARKSGAASELISGLVSSKMATCMQLVATTTRWSSRNSYVKQNERTQHQPATLGLSGRHMAGVMTTSFRMK
jgi:hypothetical protein